MLRRLGIRGKVLAALSVPVLVLFVLAGALSVQSMADVRTARTVTDLLGALDRSRDLSRAMQAERDVTLRALTGDEEAAAQIESVRATTDAAVAQAGRAARSVDLAQLDPIVLRAVTGLDDQMEEFAFLRESVDARQISPRLAFLGYSTVVERVTRFPGVVAAALDDRRLAAIIASQTDVMLLQEKYRQEQAFGAAMLRGASGVAEASLFTTLFPATDIQHEAAALGVRDLGLDSLEVPVVTSAVGTYGSQRSTYRAYVQSFVNWGQPERWTDLAEEEIGRFTPVLGELRAQAISRAQVVTNAALRTAALTIGLTLAAIAASVIIALAIARQIVVPLRRLTEAAGNVRDELPKLVSQVAIPGQGPDLTLTRIPVSSKDEVGQLATAFNEVNATTIEVAQEQAALRASISEMFVNVARRDQVLLNRQLSFIDALERSEEDPATLADLFRLDHLATRMRRNAESLLVLAGIDTGRRLREPIPVSDVIRTASSEIEHYERIQLDLPVDPVMVGHTALPAAHMLAELLENATRFSDPGTPVHVSTGRDETHVLITIFDQGLGMTPAELEEANTKIATTSASDVVGAQRLGLFVVGRIAGRLNAEVMLGAGPDGSGTLATVRIPLVLFVGSHDIPIVSPTAHAPTALETFVRPEEAAEVVHDSAYAPPPAQVQDVAPGRLGSAENPAQEVDLASLTDGRTGLGLPRRRSKEADTAAPAPSANMYREEDDAAAARSIPLAPKADALAGVAALPEEDAWTPEVVENQPLGLPRRGGAADAPAADGGQGAQGAEGVDAWAPSTPDSATPLPTREGAAPAGGLPTRGGAAPAGGLPTRGSAAPAGGLPTRQPAAPALPTREPAPATGGVTAGGLPTRTPAAAAPAAPAATGPAADVAPQSRAAMFSGFRSRRAELAAASVAQSDQAEDPSRSQGGDGAERLAAAAAGAAAFFGRSAPRPGEADEQEAPEVEMVIPSLVADDDLATDEQVAAEASGYEASAHHEEGQHEQGQHEQAQHEQAQHEQAQHAPAPYEAQHEEAQHEAQHETQVEAQQEAPLEASAAVAPSAAVEQEQPAAQPWWMSATPPVPATRPSRRGRHAYYPDEQETASPESAAPGRHADLTGEIAQVGEPQEPAADAAPFAWTPPQAEGAEAAVAADAGSVPAPAAEPVAEEQVWTVPDLVEDEVPATEQTWSAPLWEEESAEPAPAWQVGGWAEQTTELSATEPSVTEQAVAEQPVAEQTTPVAQGWPADSPASGFAPAAEAAPAWETPAEAATTDAPAWETPAEAATPAWGGVASTSPSWAPTAQPEAISSQAAETAAPAELPATAEQGAGRKRSWWPFGKGRKAEAPAAAPTAPADRPSAFVPPQTLLPAAPPVPATAPVPATTPAPEASVQDAVAPAAGWSADPTPPATGQEAEPVRASAWGAPAPGAHAAPPVGSEEEANRRAGASAFFPASRQSRTPEQQAPTGASPSWEVPQPHPAPPQPDEPTSAAAPAGGFAGGWAPEPMAAAPAEQWSPSPAPAAPEAPLVPAVPTPAAAPAAYGQPARTTFTPEMGGLDDDVATMLAQRADLAQQALAELSQLSSYRPQTVAGEGASLVRRTPGTIPAAPAIKTSPSPRPSRDAQQVRSLLSSFQSGTVRGREAADGDAPQTAGVGASLAGSENGQAEGGTTPGQDLS